MLFYPANMLVSSSSVFDICRKSFSEAFQMPVLPAA